MTKIKKRVAVVIGVIVVLVLIFNFSDGNMIDDSDIANDAFEGLSYDEKIELQKCINIGCIGYNRGNEDYNSCVAYCVEEQKTSDESIE